MSTFTMVDRSSVARFRNRISVEGRDERNRDPLRAMVVTECFTFLPVYTVTCPKNPNFSTNFAKDTFKRITGMCAILQRSIGSTRVCKHEPQASPSMRVRYGNVAVITGSNFEPCIEGNKVVAIFNECTAVNVVKVGCYIYVSVEYNAFCRWDVEGVNFCAATVQRQRQFVYNQKQNIPNKKNQKEKRCKKIGTNRVISIGFVPTHNGPTRALAAPYIGDTTGTWHPF